MEIIIKRQILLKSLQLLEPIVTSRSTLPISSDVLIQAEEKNKCVFIGTDIDTSLKCEVECKVIEGRKGPWISWPSRKDETSGKYLKQVVFKSKEYQKKVENDLLNRYKTSSSESSSGDDDE